MKSFLISAVLFLGLVSSAHGASPCQHTTINLPDSTINLNETKTWQVATFTPLDYTCNANITVRSGSGIAFLSCALSNANYACLVVSEHEVVFSGLDTQPTSFFVAEKGTLIGTTDLQIQTPEGTIDTPVSVRGQFLSFLASLLK